MIIILVDDNLIGKRTGSLFGWMKLTTNSSDANLYAVTTLMQGNTSGCLIACASYVSSNSGPLQSWSTSAFEIGCGPGNIISPVWKWARKHHQSRRPQAYFIHF